MAKPEETFGSTTTVITGVRRIKAPTLNRRRRSTSRASSASAKAICAWLGGMILVIASASGQVVINEALVNPTGPDAPNQYIELRGPPNQILGLGTYFVAVEGDTNGNPGTVQDVFDLSGK